MEDHYGLHEVSGHLTWSTSAQGGSQEHGLLRPEWKLSAETLLPPPRPRGATRHPQPGEFPDRVPAVGWGAGSHPPRLCIGLC